MGLPLCATALSWLGRWQAGLLLCAGWARKRFREEKKNEDAGIDPLVVFLPGLVLDEQGTARDGQGGRREAGRQWGRRGGGLPRPGEGLGSRGTTGFADTVDDDDGHGGSSGGAWGRQ